MSKETKYTHIEGKESTLEPCPLCMGSTGLWRYSEGIDDPISHVVMCSHAGDIGPREDFFISACVMVMPPDDFYKPRQIEAINYWNDYAIAINNLRAQNLAASLEPTQTTMVSAK